MRGTATKQQRLRHTKSHMQMQQQQHPAHNQQILKPVLNRRVCELVNLDTICQQEEKKIIRAQGRGDKMSVVSEPEQ